MVYCIWGKEKHVHNASENDGTFDGFTDCVADHLRVSDRGREKGVRATSVSSDLSHEKHVLNTEEKYRMAIYYLTKIKLKKYKHTVFQL